MITIMIIIMITIMIIIMIIIMIVIMIIIMIVIMIVIMIIIMIIIMIYNYSAIITARGYWYHGLRGHDGAARPHGHAAQPKARQSIAPPGIES
jgi:hypothetical protein